MRRSISWCGNGAGISAIPSTCPCGSVSAEPGNDRHGYQYERREAWPSAILGKLLKEAQGQFRFTLPGANISLELKGEVAWADGTGHAGIRFLDVPQTSQYQLEKWLTDRMQEEMPARLQGYSELPLNPSHPISPYPASSLQLAPGHFCGTVRRACRVFTSCEELGFVVHP
jgi:hypothetical protein